MQKHKDFHPDLLAAQKLAYEPNKLFCENATLETESEEYAACSFDIQNKHCKFRVAKITPIKVGQFVTLWKRIGNKPIMPYDIIDRVDFFVISVRCGENFGQFIFPKNIMLEKGILSKDAIGGKLAIRVYPPWDVTKSSQAQKTQAWQIIYFFEIQPFLDTEKLKKLI